MRGWAVVGPYTLAVEPTRSVGERAMVVGPRIVEARVFEGGEGWKKVEFPTLFMP